MSAKAAVAAVLLAGTLAGCGGHASAPTTTTITVTQPPVMASATPSPSVPPSPPPDHDPGERIADGPLAFQVDFGYTPGGQVAMWMWVQNDSSGPQVYATRLQSLRDDLGRVFAPDHGSCENDSGSWKPCTQVDLNPGVTIEVSLTFQVAPGTDASHYRVVVRGAPGSPGAAIRLVKPKGAVS